VTGATIRHHLENARLFFDGNLAPINLEH